MPLIRQVSWCTRSMRAPSWELWRSLAKFGELWRNLNTIFTRTFLTLTRVPVKVPHIHQSLAKVPSVCGWPSECAQFDNASVLSPGCLVLTVGEMNFLECRENNVLGFPTQRWMMKTLTICKPPPHPPPSQKNTMIGLVSETFPS